MNTQTKTSKTRTSEFSEVIGYKINRQKSLSFPYTNHEHVETDIQHNTIHYHLKGH